MMLYNSFRRTLLSFDYTSCKFSQYNRSVNVHSVLCLNLFSYVAVLWANRVTTSSTTPATLSSDGCTAYCTLHTISVCLEECILPFSHSTWIDLMQLERVLISVLLKHLVDFLPSFRSRAKEHVQNMGSGYWEIPPWNPSVSIYMLLFIITLTFDSEYGVMVTGNT